MGATTFEADYTGKTAQEAFTSAQREARFDHGASGYTGTIAEKDSFIEIPVPKEWDTRRQAYAYHLMENDDPRIDEKWGPAGCILLESRESIEHVPYATTVKRWKQEGARKWKTVFVLRANEGLYKVVDSQTEAESLAKSYSKSHNTNVEITIEKHLVNGDPRIVFVAPKTKEVKVKNGLNRYLFFGWASC